MAHRCIGIAIGTRAEDGEGEEDVAEEADDAHDVVDWGGEWGACGGEEGGAYRACG